MLPALARAAAAIAAAARNPAVRRAAIDAARKAGETFKDTGRKAVQGCRWWGRNRNIRAAYNARKRVLRKELERMRKAGASKEEMADKAYQFRRAERLKAREQMRRNGDHKSVEKLEARDMEKYGKRGVGDKDGPNFQGLQQETAAKLEKTLGRKPTRDEVFDEIANSATRTDWKTNATFLTW